MNCQNYKFQLTEIPRSRSLSTVHRVACVALLLRSLTLRDLHLPLFVAVQLCLRSASHLCRSRCCYSSYNRAAA